ncbi:TPA: hypothetical protein ACORDH_002880 [Bacillus cereus]
MLFVKKEFIPEIEKAKTFDEFCIIYKKLSKENNAIRLNAVELEHPDAKIYTDNPEYVPVHFNEKDEVELLDYKEWMKIVEDLKPEQPSIHDLIENRAKSLRRMGGLE